MRILSLFDGMACGRVALERANIEVEKYYASETDIHAIDVAVDNHSDIVHLGDIKNWKSWEIDWSRIDLLIGGSPCQGFSFAGNQLNFNDPRSKLFFIYVDILNHIKSVNPNIKFLLENVKMKRDSLDIISDHLYAGPLFINSALVSAQNRQRYYWCNWDTDIPEDKNIFLADILEHGVVDRDKSYCIDANYWKGTNVKQYISKCRRQIAFTERRTDEAKRIRKEFREKYGRDFSPRRAKELIPREDGKMNCLTANYSLKEHSLIDEKLYYRKLTPIECERLQTLPDNYTSCVSNTQRYKMIGNGWTVDVITHLLNCLIELDNANKV